MLHHCRLVLFLMLAAAASHANAQAPNAAKREELKSLDKLDWMIGTGKGKLALPGDTPGVGKKGDKVPARVTTQRIMGGNFLMSVGVAVVGEEEHELFREIWGPTAASDTIHKWLYDVGGFTAQGKVYAEGDDKVVCVMQSDVMPREGPAKKLAESLNLDMLPLEVTMAFRNVEKGTVGVTMQSVKVKGLPIPFPNVGEEMLYKFEE